MTKLIITTALISTLLASTAFAEPQVYFRASPAVLVSPGGVAPTPEVPEVPETPEVPGTVPFTEANISNVSGGIEFIDTDADGQVSAADYIKYTVEVTNSHAQESVAVSGWTWLSWVSEIANTEKWEFDWVCEAQPASTEQCDYFFPIDEDGPAIFGQQMADFGEPGSISSFAHSYMAAGVTDSLSNDFMREFQLTMLPTPDDADPYQIAVLTKPVLTFLDWNGDGLLSNGDFINVDIALSNPQDLEITVQIDLLSDPSTWGLQTLTLAPYSTENFGFQIHVHDMGPILGQASYQDGIRVSSFRHESEILNGEPGIGVEEIMGDAIALPSSGS